MQKGKIQQLLITDNQPIPVCIILPTQFITQYKRANQLNFCSSILVIQSKYRKEGGKKTFFPYCKASEWILDFWWWTTAFGMCRIAYIQNNNEVPYCKMSPFLSIAGTASFVQNLLAYPGLGHSGPLDIDGGGSSGGECPSVSCTSGTGGAQMSSLPPAMRVRLYELFVQIEREFEILYAENLSLQVCQQCLITSKLIMKGALNQCVLH